MCFSRVELNGVPGEHARIEKGAHMKCPHGNHDLDVPGTALINVDSYGNSVVVVTDCCEKPVTISPIRNYRVVEYRGSNDTDDWGRPIKKVAS